MPEVFEHHLLFRAFHTFEGWAEPGFEISFPGVVLRDWLFTGVSKGLAERRRVAAGYPEPSDEYFEWIAMLAAITTASGRFTMFELGAGWGRWSLYAARLCEQRSLPFRLTAVEPEPTHFEWLRMVFRDNGLDPADHDLRHAAISPDKRPVRIAGRDNPLHDYGDYVPTGIYGWLRCLLLRHRVRKVSAVTLAELLATCASVDLIDMDIQGMEAAVLGSVTAEQISKVRVMHIAVHSPEVAAQVRGVFQRAGWLNAFSFPCGSKAATPFGTFAFQDGIETWVNSSAATLVELMRGVPSAHPTSSPSIR